MVSFVKHFLHDDRGAVTVEWVVLTAAVIGLTVTAYTSINGSSTTLASNTDTTLNEMVVGDPIIE